MAGKMFMAAGLLFGISSLFSLISLILPDWIVSEIRGSRSGQVQVGLIGSCVLLGSGGARRCSMDEGREGAWKATFVFVLASTALSAWAAALCLSAARSAERRWDAKWVGSAALVCSSLAAVVFPAGFGAVEVGGSPYHLPVNASVGTSYVLFILSLWTLVVSQLCAGKFCDPRL